jgi:NAD-dependent deacetylase
MMLKIDCGTTRGRAPSLLRKLETNFSMLTEQQIQKAREGRILVVTGAGISADSGIPTFRGKEGYWRKLDPMKLATPEAFRANPQLVWDWYLYRRKIASEAQPNAGHDVIAKLSHTAREFLLVTQNVDDLHERAGTRRDRIVKVHGDLFVNRCFNSNCAEQNHIAVTEGTLPKCAKCSTLLRPGVVWFGEALDPNTIQQVDDFLSSGPCDLVLVIGTTAQFGYIAHWALRAAGRSGTIVEINPDDTGLSSVVHCAIRDRASTALPRIFKI